MDIFKIVNSLKMKQKVHTILIHLSCKIIISILLITITYYTEPNIKEGNLASE